MALEATMATMAPTTESTMESITGNIMQSTIVLVTTMPATQPIPQPTMQQHPKRQQLSLKDQLSTMPPTTVPHSNTTPLNTTNLAQFLTVHHLALSPRGALPPREPPSVASAQFPFTSARCPGGGPCPGPQVHDPLSV